MRLIDPLVEVVRTDAAIAVFDGVVKTVLEYAGKAEMFSVGCHASDGLATKGKVVAFAMLKYCQEELLKFSTIGC